MAAADRARFKHTIERGLPAKLSLPWDTRLFHNPEKVQRTCAFLEIEHLHEVVGTKAGTRHADYKILNLSEQQKN
ncbi:MAG: hypothetical protein ACJAYR_000923 [Sneathiella sp.]|jgi:hypothetical protein